MYKDYFNRVIEELKFDYEDGGEVGEFAKGGSIGKKNSFLQDRILAKEDIEILGVDRSKITEKEWASIFRMANYQDGGTYILKNEKGLDVSPQVEYEWYVKEKMAKGGSIELANEKYLNSIPLEKKTRILQNIADNYDISEEQAYAEITDIESEALYEYITDQTLKMHVYQMMK
jgi:hypothetical protein